MSWFVGEFLQLKKTVYAHHSKITPIPSTFTLKSYSLEPLDYILLLAGGLAAGIISTLAGNGSAITLSLLIFSGFPAVVLGGK